MTYDVQWTLRMLDDAPSQPLRPGRRGIQI